MNFIEANTILKKFTTGPILSIHLASSGNIETLLLYVRAAAALAGKKAEISTLPFGTLGQALLVPPGKNAQELIILFPWDIVPECDWRSGIPVNPSDDKMLLDGAHVMIKRLLQRQSKILYVPAVIPPMYVNPAKTTFLTNELIRMADDAAMQVLDKKYFSLGNYLTSGIPFGGTVMGEVAEIIIESVTRMDTGSSKVIITDFDNVLWAGLAAEDGPNGINCRSEGKGYKHFLYQNLLLKLKAAGILLAGVSRNDLDIAVAPIKSGNTQLKESDFVEVFASYESKSLHIKRLAAKLNLGVESFVFIDDNPIELAEVSAAIPAIKCLAFPTQDDQLPGFFQEVSRLFARDIISEEDKGRTDMYRRRLEMTDELAINEKGGDLTQFLLNLKMELTIWDRSTGSRERAIQLINKTNQFNLNGGRLNEDEVADILSAGGKLYTATLDDRSGTHGEILACLIDHENCVRSFVLSCRVFQREIEYAFCGWLIKKVGTDLTLSFQATERNKPVQIFLNDAAFTNNGNVTVLDGEAFLNSQDAKRNLFKIKEVDFV